MALNRAKPKQKQPEEKKEPSSSQVSPLLKEKNWFDQFVAQQNSWSQKEAFAQQVVSISPGENKDDVVMGLVNYRDVIDCEVYREAVANAFGEGFTVRPRSDFFVKEGPDGELAMGLE